MVLSGRKESDALLPLASIREPVFFGNRGSIQDNVGKESEEERLRRFERISSAHQMATSAEQDTSTSQYPWEVAQGQELEKYNWAAVLIQANYRRHLARRLKARLELDLNKAAADALIQQQEELAKLRAQAQRTLKQQAKDILLALYAQSQYSRTRDRHLQAKGLTQSNTASIDLPAIDPALWEGLKAMGLDPINILVKAGLSQKHIRMVLDASKVQVHSFELVSISSSSGGTPMNEAAVPLSKLSSDPFLIHNLEHCQEDNILTSPGNICNVTTSPGNLCDSEIPLESRASSSDMMMAHAAASINMQASQRSRARASCAGLLCSDDTTNSAASSRWGQGIEGLTIRTRYQGGSESGTAPSTGTQAEVTLKRDFSISASAGGLGRSVSHAFKSGSNSPLHCVERSLSSAGTRTAFSGSTSFISRVQRRQNSETGASDGSPSASGQIRPHLPYAPNAYGSPIRSFISRSSSSRGFPIFTMQIANSSVASSPLSPKTLNIKGLLPSKTSDNMEEVPQGHLLSTKTSDNTTEVHQLHPPSLDAPRQGLLSRSSSSRFTRARRFSQSVSESITELASGKTSLDTPMHSEPLAHSTRCLNTLLSLSSGTGRARDLVLSETVTESNKHFDLARTSFKKTASGPSLDQDNKNEEKIVSGPTSLTPAFQKYLDLAAGRNSRSEEVPVESQPIITSKPKQRRSSVGALHMMSCGWNS